MSTNNESGTKTQGKFMTFVQGDKIKAILIIASIVMLLAVIVLSAFSYQWHNENVTLKSKNKTLKALVEDSTITSLTNELGTTQQSLLEATSEIELLEGIIKEYEATLKENGLLDK